MGGFYLRLMQSHRTVGIAMMRLFKWSEVFFQMAGWR